MLFNRTFSLITALVFCNFLAQAQNKPIGTWRSHLPYNSALGLATDGSTIFTVCNQAFFTYNTSQNDLEPYSKVEGMAEIGMKCVGYDAATNTAILVYTDGNIDLFKNNTFYNIADLKVKAISGNKSVNAVYAENGIAYLSTTVGILVIDLTTHNINETYQFLYNNQNVPVQGFGRGNGKFYAATTAGLYSADTSNPELQNFQVWQRVDSTDSLNCIAVVNNTLFFSNNTSVFSTVNDTLRAVYTPAYPVTHIDAGTSTLLVSTFAPTMFQGKVLSIDAGFNIVDSVLCGDPVQATQLMDNSIWIADDYYGLEKKDGIYYDLHFPDGPSDPNSYDLYAYNKSLWIAHGGYNDLLLALGNRNGISNDNDDTWKLYQAYHYPPFDTLRDFVCVLKDEVSGTLYAGSYQNGLFILNSDGSYSLYDDTNSILDSSNSYHFNTHQITSLALDHERNLWLTEQFANHELYVRTVADSMWYKFKLPGVGTGGPILVDDNDQIWFIAAEGGGVFVFNNNGTINNPSDDTYYHLAAGVGYGNLPSNNALCIAKDNSNSIWIGTDNGIGIVSNCYTPFSQTPPCDANIPIVQYDQFAGYLFAGNTVKTIAVDGANRKWVGTTSGVWLLSPDAQSIVYRFTVDNSPLPSNNIQKITIDKVTGDVYIGTDQGIVTYRSTATDGGTTNQDVTVFPNPVKSGYQGTIAIKGLVANADVRITDINGQLVYKTTALGGQAVWSGLDYTGHRPQSGVYLVFASSSDGAQTYSGKIVFLQ